MKKIIYSLLLLSFASSLYAQNTVTVQDTPPPMSLTDTTALSETLKTKERELIEKEATLKAREVRLNALEQDIITREAKILEIRNEVNQKLSELEVKQDAELDNLAKIYQASKAKSAAAILINMELDKTVALFRRMTPSVAGKILNEMARADANYASKLTAALTPKTELTSNADLQ